MNKSEPILDDMGAEDLSASLEAVRESEEKYRQLFEAIDEGFCVIEVLFDSAQNATDYRFLEVNPAFKKQTGLQDAVGRCMRELAPAHEEHWFQIYGRIALTGCPRRFENRAAALHRWYDVYAFRIGRPEQHRVGVLFNDVTQRRRTEEALRDSEQYLQQTNQTLENTIEERTAKLREVIAELHKFSYAMAHDMRAPLRAMRGFAEILGAMNNAQTPPEARMYQQRIVVAAERLDNLITDALNYTVVLNEEWPMEPIDLRSLVSGLVETYPNLNREHAEISIEHLPVVIGNGSLLTQLFSNLLGNAVKFVEKGVKPWVRVWAEAPRRGSDGRPEVRIRVEDHGLGIPRYAHERVFGIFQRCHSHYPGTGIGLAIVKKSAERMGGSVGVESEEGKGSCFWVNLPLPAVTQTR